MPIKKRGYLFWTGLFLINLAAIGALVAGRHGRRDHFVVTITNGQLSIDRNNRNIQANLDVSSVPTDAIRGIRFSLQTQDTYNLPTSQKTRIENIRLYAPDGMTPLFHHSTDTLDPAVWSSKTMPEWYTLPGGGITQSPKARTIFLSPPGVPIDNYRLEFDIVNMVVLRLWPLYADKKNNIQLEYRAYPECWYEIYLRANGQGKKLARASAFGEPLHLFRSIVLNLSDSYPYLLAGTAVFLVAQLLLLTPFSALWIRLEGQAGKVKWCVLACIAALLLALSITVILLGLSSIFHWSGRHSWILALSAMIVIPAALFVLKCFLPKVFDKPSYKLPSWRRWIWALLVVICIAAGTGLTLWITTNIHNRMPQNQDAAAQLFHAQIIARGAFAAPATEHLAQGHFSFDFTLVHNQQASADKRGQCFKKYPLGRFVMPALGIIAGSPEVAWFSQYPPGHIVMLALGTLWNAPWIAPALASCLMLVSIYILGGRVGSRNAGLIAAFLVIFSPFFQMLGGTFMNHTSAAFFTCAAVLFFVIGIQKCSFWVFLCHGAFIAILIASRPLTAASIALPLSITSVAWALTSERKQRITALLGAVAGSIPVFALFLLFNYGTTGDPFLMGHHLARTGSLQSIRSPAALARALQHTLYRIWLLRRTLFDWPAYLTFAPILALFVSGRGKRWDWLLLSLCITCGLAYSLYPYFLPMFGPRYWYEMLPLLCVLSARGVVEITALGRHYIAASSFNDNAFRYQLCGWYGAVAILLVAFTGWTVNDFWLRKGPNVMHIHPWVTQSLTHLKNWTGVSHNLHDAVREEELTNAVVFVNAGNQQHYWSVFPLNSPFFDSEVIYPRCLGSRADRRLMKLFPARTAYVAQLTRDGWTLDPYPEEMAIPKLAADVTGSDHTRPQIVSRTPNRPEALAAHVASAYPGWELISSEGGSMMQIGGQMNVIHVHPLSTKQPAVLRWRGKLTPDSDRLAFGVCAPPDHRNADTLVQAWIGEDFLGQVRVNENGPGAWIPCSYDIADYAGKEIEIDIWAVATGWHYEYACVADIKITSSGDSVSPPSGHNTLQVRE